MSDLERLLGDQPREEGSIQIRYRNHRGEVAIRQITPLWIWYGHTEWHPEPQWFLDAFDLNKQQERSFALRDVLDFDGAASGRAADTGGRQG